MGVYQKPRSFDERFEEVCTLFPLLGQRRKQRAGSLSGGERQMVAMGRALMMDPSVLLLDEPSAGLSPVFQDEVFIRCRQINETGVSIVMVEQNARRCLQICHRGYVLDQGPNAYTGTGDELLNDPKVIELYLGTLAKAVGPPAVGGKGPWNAAPALVPGPRSVAWEGYSPASKRSPEGVARCCRRPGTSGCRSGRGPPRPSADQARRLDSSKPISAMASASAAAACWTSASKVWACGS